MSIVVLVYNSDMIIDNDLCERVEGRERRVCVCE